MYYVEFSLFIQNISMLHNFHTEVFFLYHLYGIPLYHSTIHVSKLTPLLIISFQFDCILGLLCSSFFFTHFLLPVESHVFILIAILATKTEVTVCVLRKQSVLSWYLQVAQRQILTLVKVCTQPVEFYH